MVDEFTTNIKKGQSVVGPATKNLFDMYRSKIPNKNKAELFYTTVARVLFLCKRTIPDIHPTIGLFQIQTRISFPVSLAKDLHTSLLIMRNCSFKLSCT